MLCEVLQRLQKRREVDSTRKSPFLTDKDKNKKIGPSRISYKSPTPSVSRRCVSPNVIRTGKGGPSAQTASKRAFSAERKRPSTPPSPSLSADPQSRIATLTLTGSKLPDLLWPSTMRSLGVSFQPDPDSDSVPITKKLEKSAGHAALSDRTLKPSSNVAQKQPETATVPLKATLDSRRRRSPLRGESPSNQSENCRSDMIGKTSDVMFPTVGISSLRRLSTEGIPRSLHMNRSNAGGGGHALIDEITKTSFNMKAVDDSLLKFSMLHKQNLTKTLEKPASRLSSSKASSSSKGTSPSRIRPSSPPQKMRSASVLDFVHDLKKGKKSVNQLEDAYRMRLLYNTYLQWRFANAQGDAALHIERILAEEALYNVWKGTLELRDSIIIKRIDLQQLQLELTLSVILNEQLAYLEDWALLERDHSISLAGAIKDLESSTVRLHVTGGATGCLVSELAELAAQEMAMLDDCQNILASTADVQEQEYSLRVQLIQHLQNYK